MGKLLAVDNLEIRFEKQHPSHASKWCIYIRAKLGEKTKSLLMIKTDNKPYTAFNYDNGRTVTHSQEAKEEILSDKTKKTSNLERAYHNASNSAFKTMWLKKIFQLQGNNGKK